MSRHWTLRPDAAQVKEMIRREVESILGSTILRQTAPFKFGSKWSRMHCSLRRSKVVMRWLTTPHWWTPVWTAKTCHAELKWIENWQRDCFPLELTLKVHQDSLSAVQFRNDLTRDFNVKLLGTRYIPVSRKWLQWSSTRCNSHFSLDLWMLRVNQASFTDARSQVCR